TRYVCSFRVFFLLVFRRPARSPLFPYTTLFRSRSTTQPGRFPRERAEVPRSPFEAGRRWTHAVASAGKGARAANAAMRCPLRRRSEEHTSELQSRENLVCRLLLEKKNTNRT